MNQRTHTNVDMDDLDGVEALNRAWDTWNAHSTKRVTGEDDLSELLVELQAIDDTPAPDPVFLAALRADLIAPLPVPSAAPIRQSSLGLVALPAMTAPFPRLTPIRLAFAGIAAALLIAALVGGNRWLPGSGSAVMVASAMASPVSRDVPTATTYPDRSAGFDGSRSSSFDRTTERTVIYPTAIPFSLEKPTFDVLGSRAVHTPAIVYSIE